MDMTPELAKEMAAESGIPYVMEFSMRVPSSGRLFSVAKVAKHRTVDCSDYRAAVDSIDNLISLALYRGLTVTRPQACAAVWSVPDGAPLEMALDNVGVELDPNAADRMEQWGVASRKNLKGIPFGRMG